MRLVVVCLLAVGCGHAAPAPAPVEPSNSGGDTHPPEVLLTLATSACMGACPIYTAALYDDGTLVFEGIEHVASPGRSTSQVDRATVEAVVDAFASARFAELDDQGNLPKPMDCRTDAAGVTTCYGSSIGCSDTSHTQVTYGGRTLDDPHCEDTDLSRLEDQVIAMLRLRVWIGGD
jgi:hypothetical protein